MAADDGLAELDPCLPEVNQNGMASQAQIGQTGADPPSKAVLRHP